MCLIRDSLPRQLPEPGAKRMILVGARENLLRRAGDSWTVARRTVLLNQTVLAADNLSMFLWKEEQKPC